MKLELLTKKLVKNRDLIIAPDYKGSVKFLSDCDYVRLTKQIECDHKFYIYGFGYKCDKCECYTGTWNEINIVIKKNLKEKK